VVRLIFADKLSRRFWAAPRVRRTNVFGRRAKTLKSPGCTPGALNEIKGGAAQGAAEPKAKDTL